MQTAVQFVAISFANGSVAIMQFFTAGMLSETEAFEREATDEAIEAEIAATQSEGDVLSWRRIEADGLPDRTFRGAWRDVGGSIVVDMPAARDIHRERLRIARAPLLAALDVEYQRADELGDEALKSAVAERKQVLRDLPDDPEIDVAVTSEQLAALWPVSLF